MARIALGLFAVVVLLSTSGCAWTNTYHDFPPNVAAERGHQHHDHAMHAEE
jgi:hypothetical protein